MQFPPDPATEFSTPLPSTNDHTVSPLIGVASGGVDPLLAHTSKRLDEVMNDLRRQLLDRDGSSLAMDVQGSIRITIETESLSTYQLSFTVDLEDQDTPFGVSITQDNGKSITNGQPRWHRPLPAKKTLSAAEANSSNSTYKPPVCATDKELDQDFIPRRKRQLDGGNLEDGGSRKRWRADVEPGEDIMPLITKEELDELLVKLRDDVQEDTAEIVNHVKKILRNWKGQWREKSSWEFDQLHQLASQQTRLGFLGLVDETAGKGVGGRAGSATEVFPSPAPTKETPSGGSNLLDAFRKEARLISSQIRWVEDCRRVASDSHDKREETWRTTSAGFHDKNRQDREAFQARILQESAIQGRMLNQILNEVKAMSHVTMSLKWETPGQMSHSSAYPTSVAATGAIASTSIP